MLISTIARYSAVQVDKLSKTKLKETHWYIFDSSGIKSEVEGNGVIGIQPILLASFNPSPPARMTIFLG